MIIFVIHLNISIMAKLVSFLHLSLDGFAAGPNKEMDWILIDESMFDLSDKQSDQSGIALYGRVTYELMDGYWPTAADEPGASKHDRHHAAWYKTVPKVIVSKTMKGASIPNARIISDDLLEAVTKLKVQAATDIVMFGSPTTTGELSRAGLIDEYWIFVNPLILGQGIRVFQTDGIKLNMELLESVPYPNGVVGLHYAKR